MNNLLSVGNKGNNFHGGVTGGTSQGVDFIDLINETSPGGAARRSRRGIINNGSIRILLRRFSFASGSIGIIAVVADKGFIGIRDMEADAVEKFDDREDLEITFFSGMEGGGIEYGIGIFDIVDFVRGEGRVDNILSEIEQGGIIIFFYGDIGMDRETGMAP
jgi:hypothetical protein